MIKNIIAMDSIFNNINKPAALRKTRIKKITECIGFSETITIAAGINAMLANKSNKSVWISVYRCSGELRRATLKVACYPPFKAPLDHLQMIVVKGRREVLVAATVCFPRKET